MTTSDRPKKSSTRIPHKISHFWRLVGCAMESLLSSPVLQPLRAFAEARVEQLLELSGRVQSSVAPLLGLSPSTDLRVPIAVALLLCWYAFKLVALRAVKRYVWGVRVPQLHVPLTPLEAQLQPGGKWDPATPFPKDYVPCYDPGSLHLLGSGRAHADTPAEVLAKVDAAHAAQLVWARSSFAQRRKLLRIMQRFILDNQHTICAVSARDSGKPMVDAAFGEVMVTLEKINWLCDEGEQWLRPERRSAGTMMFYKHASVQYVPVGVMGAIVPWNYPFHNVFNPLLSNLFAGNALVVKVSEFATWSSEYYGRVIKAALAAAGAPTDLVQIVTGYGEAGHALVTAPKVGKLVFVGSTAVGRKVMAAASAHLKPVVLELGGKDAFIVCDDADLAQVVPIALRGAFQSCGQNCAGAERFFVQRPLYDAFVRQVGAATEKMRAGWALNPSGVDAGAMCMPQQAAFVKGLVDDAVKQGAVVIAQARIVGDGCGQFCAPCVLAGVTQSMRISQEEVFGPVLCVSAFDSDDEAVRLANGCAFGLGSSVFSRSGVRARRIAGQLQAGMSSINDFATTYMAQSLPFGGVKESGFDRFAGVEGLRGCCIPKAFAQDRWPWLIRTDIPPPLQYPVKAYAFDFVASLIKLFYGMTLWDRVKGVAGVIACFLLPARKHKAD